MNPPVKILWPYLISVFLFAIVNYLAYDLLVVHPMKDRYDKLWTAKQSIEGEKLDLKVKLDAERQKSAGQYKSLKAQNKQLRVWNLKQALELDSQQKYRANAPLASTLRADDLPALSASSVKGKKLTNPNDIYRQNRIVAASLLREIAKRNDHLPIPPWLINPTDELIGTEIQYLKKDFRRVASQDIPTASPRPEDPILKDAMRKRDEYEYQAEKRAWDQKYKAEHSQDVGPPSPNTHGVLRTYSVPEKQKTR